MELTTVVGKFWFGVVQFWMQKIKRQRRCTLSLRPFVADGAFEWLDGSTIRKDVIYPMKGQTIPLSLAMFLAVLVTEVCWDRK